MMCAGAYNKEKEGDLGNTRERLDRAIRSTALTLAALLPGPKSLNSIEIILGSLILETEAELSETSSYIARWFRDHEVDGKVLTCQIEKVGEYTGYYIFLSDPEFEASNLIQFWSYGRDDARNPN